MFRLCPYFAHACSKLSLPIFNPLKVQFDFQFEFHNSIGKITPLGWLRMGFFSPDLEFVYVFTTPQSNYIVRANARIYIKEREWYLYSAFNITHATKSASDRNLQRRGTKSGL